MSKYIICQSVKKFHRAVFSIAHPKYSNFGGILDARWLYYRAVFSIAHPKYSNFGGILDARWLY